MSMTKEIFSEPLTYKRLEMLCGRLASLCPRLRVSTLAYSICGRRIPYLHLGEGKRSVLYVAGHHAMEWICGLPLLAFAHELCCLWQPTVNGGAPGNDNRKDDCESAGREDARQKGAETEGAFDALCTPRLLEQYRFVIVPQLNPDGVAMQMAGADPEHVLYRRQLNMNGGSTDFSRWQANARGVDLNHNYSVGFCEYRKIEMERGILGGAPSLFSGAYPESEPETAALANLIRLLRPSLILTLHTQGEEIYFDAPHATPAMHRMAEGLATLTGYQPAVAASTAAYGGLTEWAVRCGIPSFTLECGKGENPLPLDGAKEMYDRLRSAFFCAPQLSYL